MAKYYKIQIIKKDIPPEKSKVDRNYTDDFRFPIAVDWFKSTPKIESLKKSKKKAFIEKKLKNVPKNNINQTYDYEKEEEVKMISEGENNPVIYEGKVKIPKHIRKEENKGQNQSNFGDMK